MVINEPHTGGKVVSRAAEAPRAHVHACVHAVSEKFGGGVSNEIAGKGEGEAMERSSNRIWGVGQKEGKKEKTARKLYPRFLSTDLKAISLSLSF